MGRYTVYRARLLALILSSLLLLAGLAYLLYLHFLFPKLIPGYGGGERFSLNKANNYTFQIPWSAYSRLHLTVQANETLELYINDGYVCKCNHYNLVIEPGEEALILLRSSSSVSGMFTAWQEVPLEKQVFASSLLLTGLVTTVLSVKIKRKK